MTDLPRCSDCANFAGIGLCVRVIDDKITMPRVLDRPVRGERGFFGGCGRSGRFFKYASRMNHAYPAGDNPEINAPKAGEATETMRTPTESEMRVAKAMYDQNMARRRQLRIPDRPSWGPVFEQLQPDVRAIWIGHARAAIRAMREPPAESWDAMASAGKMWRELNSTTVWQTFIDAASPPEGA